MFRNLAYVRVLIACVFSLLIPTAVSGQIEISSFHQLDLSQFGAHLNASKIVQDSLGFVWIASNQGLIRFDGVHFRSFTKKSHPNLPSDNIHSILVNYDGNLWIATEEGLAVMDPRKELIKSYSLIHGSIPTDVTPTFLFLSQDSSIWVGLTDNRVARISSGQQIPEIISFEINGFPFGDCFEVGLIVENQQGVFLQATCALNDAIIHIKYDSINWVAKVLRKEETNTIKLFSSGEKILLIDFQGVYEFNNESGVFEKLHATDREFYEKFFPHFILEAEKNSYLVGGRFGAVERLFINGDTIYTRNLGRIGLAGILDIMKDRSGCIWLGTDDGVYYFTDRNPRFKTYLSKAASNEPYGHKIRAIVEGINGDVYVGGSFGLYRIKPGRPAWSEGERWLLSLPYSLLFEDEATLWIGTEGYGIKKFDTHNGEFYDIISPFSGTYEIAGIRTYEMLRDSDGMVWIGTDNGISYGTGIDGDLKIAKDIDGRHLLQNRFIHDIKEIRQGNFWVGTNRGLYHLAMVGKPPDTYFLLSEYPDVAYKVREICQTSSEDLWMATEDAGLVHYHPGTKQQQRFTRSNGLPSDVLYSLLPGPLGELWIGTFKGLSRFDTTAHQFSNFFVADGLPHNEFNSQSQLISRDGTYYMGTQNGIVAFRPEAFDVDSSNLQVIINSVVVHNTKLDSTFTESRYSVFNERLNLGPHDNLVTINYSIADYTNPENNSFQYWLEGLYQDWHFVGSQSELVLPHLPPGDYTLWIKGAGSDGRWSTSQASIPITVHAAYYNTWWFRLLVLAIVMGIMWLIHQYRLNQVLEIQKIRLRISEDLHDELGSSLTGISIQTQLLSKSETSHKRASKLKELSGYLQESISKLGDIVWSLQSDSGSLDHLMDRVEEQTHMMLDPEEVECHIALSRDYGDLPLRAEVLQNCFLIFKEALTNVVKHSNASRVEVKVQYTKQGLFLEVHDNGRVSAKRALPGHGNGLNNMRRRAEKISGRLNLHNHEGFRVELLVPKQQLN